MFVDASALCAILLDEPERDAFERKLAQSTDAVTSPIAIWETVRAMVRVIDVEPARARARLQVFLQVTGIQIIEIGPAETEQALNAMARFGKGFHRASLNMGDCFAFGCAKARGVALLFKGDDFVHTDIEVA